MIDQDQARELLEQEEGALPFCGCGARTVPAARRGMLWIECSSLAEGKSPSPGCSGSTYRSNIRAARSWPRPRSARARPLVGYRPARQVGPARRYGTRLIRGHEGSHVPHLRQ